VIEPFTHPAPIGEGWAEGLEHLGFSVDRRTSSNGAEYDLTVAFDPRDIAHSGRTVLVVHDVPNFDIGSIKNSVAGFVSHTTSHKSMDEAFSAAGASVHHVPFGGHYWFSSAEKREHQYDWSFVGSFYHNGGNRDQESYYSPIVSKYPNGFTRIDGNVGGRTRRLVPYSELAGVYASSKINLNFHFPFQKGPDPVDLNMRSFDICVAGGFQLCDHPEVVKLFDGAVATAEKCDWLDTFDYYLSHDAEREEMAARAQSIALARHTWKSRVEEVLGWLP
jgi:hypothetical protein